MQLTRYEQARQALEAAHSLDEVKDIADKVEAMRLYARQARDPEMEIWLAEIRLRALRRLGEISKELDTAERVRTDLLPDAGKQTKRSRLAEAGLSTSQAHRCEQIASIDEADFEGYLARKRSDQKPVTVEEVLRAVLRDGATLATKWTGDPESYTPSGYVEAARRVLGEIDLDPASCDEAQKIVQAHRYLTARQDGLSCDWMGRVFLNPPYRQPDIALFVEKLCASIESGAVPSAILLTNNNTDTTWWHQAACYSAAVCFTRGRIQFHKSDGSRSQPTNGQTFFYFGSQASLFADEFSEFGLVLRTSW